MFWQILKGEVQLAGLQLSLTSSDNSVSIHSNILLIVNLLTAKVCSYYTYVDSKLILMENHELYRKLNSKRDDRNFPSFSLFPKSSHEVK